MPGWLPAQTASRLFAAQMRHNPFVHPLACRTWYRWSVTSLTFALRGFYCTARTGHGGKTLELFVSPQDSTKKSLRCFVLNDCLNFPDSALSEELTEKLVLESATVVENDGQHLGQVRCTLRRAHITCLHWPSAPAYPRPEPPQLQRRSSSQHSCYICDELQY